MVHTTLMLSGSAEPEPVPSASEDLENLLNEVQDRINERPDVVTLDMLARAVPEEGTIEEKVRALHGRIMANEFSVEAAHAMRWTAATAVQAHVRGRLSRKSTQQTPPPIPSLACSSVARPSMCIRLLRQRQSMYRQRKRKHQRWRRQSHQR